MEKIHKTYFGGKEGAGVYQQIINLIRPHDVYMELFAGNAAVFRHKKPANHSNVIMDLDEQLIATYKDLVPGSTHRHFKKVMYVHADAINFLKNYQFCFPHKYAIYLDPPYPLSSRKSDRDRYKFEMTDEQHIELLEIVLALPGHIDVLISTYQNQIYEKYLASWHLTTFQSRTRQGTATEYLYTNYTPGNFLHEYTYIGKNFTDRQRIKRKIDRYLTKLDEMPEQERNALISAISGKYSQ